MVDATHEPRTAAGLAVEVATTMARRTSQLAADIRDVAHDLTPLLEWAERDEAAGHEGPADPDD